MVAPRGARHPQGDVRGDVPAGRFARCAAWPRGGPWPHPVDPERTPVLALDVRRFAERDHNITHWSELERGGNFLSLEQPEAFVADVRPFFGGFGD
ncbi:hypothetical protein [Streptomyces sp. NPDC002324]